MLSPPDPSHMVRAGLAEQAAKGLIRNHGVAALTILADRAERAEELGHQVAAKTWRGIADAAVRLLQRERPDPDLARPAPFGSPRAARFSPGRR